MMGLPSKVHLPDIAFDQLVGERIAGFEAGVDAFRLDASIQVLGQPVVHVDPHIDDAFKSYRLAETLSRFIPNGEKDETRRRS